MCVHAGVMDRNKVLPEDRGMVLGKPAKEGESPVPENGKAASRIQSTTGHEKPCRKKGGPPPKAKYSSVTDREEYCEGEPETLCLQAVELEN